MIWQQLKTLCWLRWRITRRKFKQSGVIGSVLGGILVVGIVTGMLISFSTGLVAGLLIFPKATTEQVMLTWAVMIGCFLFAWTIGLITDIQRSEMLPLDRMLHLPITHRGVFVLNYLSSLFSLTFVIGVPGFVGCVIAHLFVHGLKMFMIVPSLLALFFMVTGVTYHLRGWLAMLMEDKRRRKRILMGIMMCFILVTQVPNMLMARDRRAHRVENEQRNTHLANRELDLAFSRGEITEDEYVTKYSQPNSGRKEKADATRRRGRERSRRWFNRIIIAAPPGWPIYGIGAMLRGNIWPTLLATIGSTIIGVGSLWRSYGSTVRHYRGEVTKRKRASTKKKAPSQNRLANWIEKDVPGLSGRTSAVMMLTLRTIQRAPEMKMALMAPILIMACIGISQAFSSAGLASIPANFRPLVALLPLWICMFTLMSQVTQNAFGFDRHGFRAYVLSPIPRHEILLGKNLALLPVVMGLSLIYLAAVQFLMPLRLSHLAATVLQAISMFFLICITSNLAAILAPSAVSSQALKRSQPTLFTILVQMLFAFVSPAVCVPLLLPYGVELGLSQIGWLPRYLPVYLLISIPLSLGVLRLYWLVVKNEGQLLKKRELRILQAVSRKVD